MLKRTALRRMVMSLLETGRHPMKVFTMSLWKKKFNAMLVFVLFSNENKLVSFLCRCFAKVPPPQFTESKDVSSILVHFMC